MEHTAHGSIVVLHKSVAPAELQRLLAFTQEKESDFVRSKVYTETTSDITEPSEVRTSLSLYVSPTEHKVEDLLLFNIFGVGLKKYADFMSKYPIAIVSDEGYIINKYNMGGKFDVHVDDHSTRIRRISCLLYLNDDYEGGELYFPVQDLKIKPKAGDMILFPSGFEYPHASLPITKGTKLAITTWFR
jgi:Rps23 Pro-64 3,4-dihydroxylase Tpa1-like proline 4-hydroxylase